MDTSIHGAVEQEHNPDAEIRRLTAEMNALFAANHYVEAARIALSITVLSKDEWRDTFERHGVTILHLDHEAFGIYRLIEPSYDLRVSRSLGKSPRFVRRHPAEGGQKMTIHVTGKLFRRCS